MTKIKKVAAVIVALATVAGSVASALEINTFSEELKVYYEGTDVYADTAEKPIIINDRTMVPLRPIFEAMGWENENITYDDATKTARFEGGDVSCEFANDSDTAIQYWSDGTTADFLLDVPATIYNDRFYIPLRAFCEIWGQNIEWVNEERSVYVTEPEQVENVTEEEVEENTEEVVDNGILLSTPEEAAQYVKETLIERGFGTADVEEADWGDWFTNTVETFTRDGQTYYLVNVGAIMETHTTHITYFAVSADTSVFCEAEYYGDINEIKFYED